MRKLLVLPALAALALAGCGKSSVTAENESAEAVAKKVAASDIKPTPGRWESKVKFERMDIAGVPPEAKAAMQKQMGAEHTFSSCLTPEQVNQPNGGFFGGGGKDCTYKHFAMVGGKIDAEMTCGQGMGSQTMTMSGTYSETSYDIKVNSKGEVQPGKSMTMALAVAARRTGECDGKEDITAKDVKEMQDFTEKHSK
jgi:hypothetical protein